jgi:maltose alpha-D-glucosyltransferase/alpha-amylase
MTIAVLQAHVENQGHAWDYTAAFLDDLIAAAQAQGIVVSQPAELTVRDILTSTGETPPEAVTEQLEPWLRLARLLGERTAELHRALTQVPSQPAFAPEPYTLHDRRSMYQAMRGQTARALRCLRLEASGLPDGDQRLAVALLDQEQELYGHFRAIVELASPGYRIRGHGNLHLGQVLMARDDIVFVDFEGVPDRLLEERRLKRSPLRDIASMLHSMQLAALQAGVRHRGESADSPEQAAAIEALLGSWCRCASKAFVTAYLRVALEDAFLPPTAEDRAVLLDVLLLERAVDDLENALLHRPSAAPVTMELLSRLLRGS